MKFKIEDCIILEIPKFGNREGYISSVSNNNEIPFEIKRVFYLYDIPMDESRGAHAHKECKQFLIALSGSFQVEIFDGIKSKIITLNRPDQGLLIPEGIWASEVNFSNGAICLVLASHSYDEFDYIRDLDTFLNFRTTKN